MHTSTTPLLLSLSTATPTCTVALHLGGALLSSQAAPKPQAHSQVLTTIIAHTLQQTGQTPHDLHGIAITGGPGSYTGLRIGATTAKAMAYALGCPLITVDTLHTLPLPYGQEEGYWCVLLDARHGRAYATLLDQHGKPCTPTHGCLVEAATFDPWAARGPLRFVGSGAEAYAATLHLTPPHTLLHGYAPHAAAMGRAAHTAWQARTFVDVATFEPSYRSASHLT